MAGNLPEELLDIDTSDILGEDEEEGSEVEQEETEQFTIFELGGYLHSAPVLEVREIVEPSEITRVPRTSEAIDGIMDLRGEITAVINPWSHLALPREPSDWDEQLVAVFSAGDDQPAGIRIDDVVGVERFPVSQVTRDVDASVPGPNTASPLVEGVVTREDEGKVTERIGILDTEGVIAVSGQHPHRVGVPDR